MKVQPYTATKPEPMEGHEGITVRWVISKEDGAPHFAMRVFEVQPGASSPYHQHPWEHEVFILEGQGTLKTAQDEVPFEPQYVVYVAPNEWHQFINRGQGALRFLCLIPHVE